MDFMSLRMSINLGADNLKRELGHQLNGDFSITLSSSITDRSKFIKFNICLHCSVILQFLPGWQAGPLETKT